jgi:hypothetical protein
MLERVKAARYGVISAPRKRVTPVTAIGELGRFDGALLEAAGWLSRKALPGLPRLSITHMWSADLTEHTNYCVTGIDRESLSGTDSARGLRKT